MSHKLGSDMVGTSLISDILGEFLEWNSHAPDRVIDRAHHLLDALNRDINMSKKTKSTTDSTYTGRPVAFLDKSGPMHEVRMRDVDLWCALPHGAGLCLPPPNVQEEAGIVEALARLLDCQFDFEREDAERIAREAIGKYWERIHAAE